MILSEIVVISLINIKLITADRKWIHAIFRNIAIVSLR